MAKTADSEVTCFILEKGMKGLSFGKNEPKMGWNVQPTSAVIMEEVRVPEKNIIGAVGDGFKIAMKGLDGGRINIASCSLGGAAYAIEEATRYLKERKAFGKTLSQF